MCDTPIETTLLEFCELMNRWRDSGHADELRTPFATIEAAMPSDDTDAAKMMSRELNAVTGTRLTLAAPHTWGGRALH